MADETPASRLDDAIRAYQSGETAMDAARIHHVGVKRLREALVGRDLWRDRATTRATASQKAWATRGQLLLPVDELLDRYTRGESELALARHYAVSRPTIRKRLIEGGATLRDMSAAQRLKMARMTPEQRQAQSAAAHAAVRGSTVGWERKCKSARTRQERQTHVSPAELALQCWLQQRGIVSVPQLAIGPYNADLATGPVIVEIFGGGWHATGDHRHRTAERYRYIFDQGFSAVIVWVNARHHPLRVAAADYIASYLEIARRNPPARGEYRVIWGDGQDVTPACLDLDNIARVPPLR